ncbi:MULTISPECIES: hypothetical protein [Alicyclobacillus]|uniref:Uncharacterized protein n=1 Tax=Alicyclobacillus acidoterrestris (strain ATCC 49025 / DSM 3922 / CIP 106132 / NCIMB 13137 / GD3B) TaxID=1356854 RepID=T0C1Q9_ALIAG|nr:MULTISPECIES: hypothetical protein [Alicyclobacillus]EPZ50208.1 hypothetical protein N007_21150 [Alicyclobacillus acidoterrestris ATCC 49025]UNO48734.1 hypothetical protein K1I37_19120 [Alicyclobacillus acidoterrestris]GEO25908.1 hypothetical protein AAC03nite_16930 [Alicyclobacillus acidoterrestris]
MRRKPMSLYTMLCWVIIAIVILGQPSFIAHQYGFILILVVMPIGYFLAFRLKYRWLFTAIEAIVIDGLSLISLHHNVKEILISIFLGPVLSIGNLIGTQAKQENANRDKEGVEVAIHDERVKQRVSRFISACALPFLVVSLVVAFVLQHDFHIQQIPTSYVELYLFGACVAVLVSSSVIMRR